MAYNDSIEHPLIHYMEILYVTYLYIYTCAVFPTYEHSSIMYIQPIQYMNVTYMYRKIWKVGNCVHNSTADHALNWGYFYFAYMIKESNSKQFITNKASSCHMG